MARPYLDHDVSIRLASPLWAAGHEATTARDAGLEHASDDAQLLPAPGSRSYAATDSEECFASAMDPEAAGYRAPRKRQQQMVSRAARRSRLG